MSGYSSRPSSTIWQNIAIILLGMVALLNLYSTQPILGNIARWAEIETTSATWTISMTTAGVAVTAPFAGLLSDKIGRKKVISSAVAAMVILTGVAIFSWSYAALLFFRFVQGMCCPFVFAVTVAYIREEYSAPTAARLNALYVAGTAFGGFAGRMLAASIVDLTGSWRLSFVGNTLLLLLTLIVVNYALPAEKNFQPSPAQQSIWEFWRKAGSLILNPRILATVLIGVSLLFQQVASFTFASLALAEPPFNLSPSIIGLIFVVFLLPTLTTPVFGRLMSSIGAPRTFLISQLIGALGIGLTFISHPIPIILGLALSCIAVFAGQAAATATATTLAPQAKSTVVGLYLSGYYLGGAIGGVAPIPLYQNGGWPAVATVLLIVIAFAIALALWAWRRPRPASTRTPE